MCAIIGSFQRGLPVSCLRITHKRYQGLCFPVLLAYTIFTILVMQKEKSLTIDKRCVDTSHIHIGFAYLADPGILWTAYTENIR
jgi:hypothetical protein